MRKVSLLLLFVGFCIQPVWATEEEDELKGSFDAVLEELNTKDLDGFLARWHDQAVLYVPRYFFPVDKVDAGREVWNEIFEDFFVMTHSATLTPVDLDYRVVGATGMIWGLVQSVVEPKSGGRITQMTRLTVTFVKQDGNWKILNWHGSLPPPRQGTGASEADQD